MRISQLPLLPNNVRGVTVPCTYNGADYQTYVATGVFNYVDDTSARANISLNSSGYAEITVPTISPSAKLLAVTPIVWTSSNAIVLTPYGDTRAFVIGDPNATVTGLKCRFWYWEAT